MRIHTIDQEFLGTPQVIASYLIEAPKGNLLIETGPASTRAVLEKKIEELGFALDSIRHVLVTHIHLDHSGGAGYWAERGATVYVHPKGARHLISPERLLASAQRIYLERMDELWGTTIACPPDRVAVFDDEVLHLGGLEVRAYDTPGHAGHHLAFGIEDVLFTGDVAGVSLPGSDYVSVPAPPPEFDREAWFKSLETLSKVKANKLYLTHFGLVEDPESHFSQLKERIKECVEFIETERAQSTENLEQRYSQWDRERATAKGLDDETYSAYERANPSFMSAQGIARYLHKRDEIKS